MSIPASGFAGLCSRTDREKPIIAAVNGVAMGGGLEIILACDIAIADPLASFALPEVKVGLFAAAGGLQRLTRQIGEKAAMELILTGRKIGSDEASKLGLINTISEPQGVMKAARVLAATIVGQIMMAPRWLVQKYIDNNELQELHIEPTLHISQNPGLAIYLLYQKQQYLVPKVKVAVDFLMARFTTDSI